MSQNIEKLEGCFIMNGHFKLTKVLGTGAFGTVYTAVRAVGKGVGEKFAVKVMPRPDVGPKQKLMLDELRLQAAVGGHKNVVEVREVSNETLNGESYACIRMDLCDVGDIFTATRKGVFDKEERVRSAVLQIIDGMIHCHQRQVFHRDLKPDNILCSMEGKDVRVRIADFGLATDQQVCYEEDGVYGTMKYMPPERFRLSQAGATYSPEKQDTWAIGYILATMCNGKFPWAMASATDPWFRRYLEDADVLAELLPLVSQELVKVLKGALDTSPASRMSLKELREHVEKVPLFKKEEKRGFWAKLFD
jgi:serine/threonine protein kinase